MATREELERAYAELQSDAAVFKTADAVELALRHPRLREIPSPVLYDGNRLVAWCEQNGMRPTWLEVEGERRRRQQVKASQRRTSRRWP